MTHSWTHDGTCLAVMLNARARGLFKRTCIFEAVATGSDIICPILWRLKRNSYREKFILLFPPDWGVRCERLVLHSAATSRVKTGILDVCSITCQARAKWEFLKGRWWAYNTTAERRHVWVCSCRAVVWGSELLWCYNKDTLAVHIVLLSSPTSF